MIKNFEPRLYQQTILATASLKNTLVVLPTGMGKTNIFLMLAAQRLRQYPNSKILMLGPTRPLIDQYRNVFEKFFDIPTEKLITFTGQVKPEKRQEQWKEATIIFSTPQGLENDIINNRISLKEVSLLGFDEAHRAVGDYSYVWIAKKYHQLSRFPRIIAMTASPGSDMEKINEVCKNLFIEDVELRSDQDPDVKPYIQDIEINWEKVEFPDELKAIQKYLKDCYKSKMEQLKAKGYVHSITEMSKKDLLGLQAGLHAELSRNRQDFDVMKAISIAAEALKIQHALELLETQGLIPLHNYLNDLQRQSHTTKTKAVINLVKDINFRSALIKTENAIKENIQHPKLIRLKEILKEKIPPKNTSEGFKVIIFNQFRDSAQMILEEISKLSNVDAKLFVGQQKKGTTGMSQKEQIKMLEDFKNNEFNTIIMTSVGEEGLDIPKVDLVIFYEPIPSAIRHIQRRGRTGRQDKGQVTILMTKDTRDEAYRWSAHHKEKRMHMILKKLKDTFHHEFTLKKQATLSSFEANKPTIYVDNREKGNDIPKRLIDIGAEVKLKQLETADYIVSSRTGIEYKKVEDFIASLVDGRLLSQAASLVKNFERPLVIVEGKESIFGVRNIHPNAIRGLIAAITVDFRIPIIYTQDPNDTAETILAIAKREQDNKQSEISLHQTKKPLTSSEQKEYIVSSLPNVGPNLAKELLKTFGSVKEVMNASEDELQKVEKVGKSIASKIKNIIDEKYDQK
ncbi:DEAD/DEAH box helicase [Candidatus Woesearchaeota archaeon]|nr:DEAD/DEAH box helicase [Candidatus Woesearchaeota archaeon]